MSNREELAQLVANLRQLARYIHDDFTIGEEAADVIESMQAKLDALEALYGEAADAIERMSAALTWYADEARACAKNSGSSRHHAPQALLATVTVMALDGGRRADDALRPNV